MRIAELAQATNTSPRLLRYYEEQGLLSPRRTHSGYRDYTDDDRTAVGRIRQLLAAGLSTTTIATVLPCLREDESALVPTCPELLSDLQREHDRLDQAIDDLTVSRDAIATVIGAGKALYRD